jgi:hypothetical protein
VITPDQKLVSPGAQCQNGRVKQGAWEVDRLGLLDCFKVEPSRSERAKWFGEHHMPRPDTAPDAVADPRSRRMPARVSITR